MAVSITVIDQGSPIKSSHIADVTATADADVTATIPHGLGAVPTDVSLTPLISQALTALSAWAVTTIDATNVVLTKLASVGSGDANPQVRVRASRPHSTTR